MDLANTTITEGRPDTDSKMFQTALLDPNKQRDSNEWKSKSLDPKEFQKYFMEISSEPQLDLSKILPPQQSKSIFKKLFGKNQIAKAVVQTATQKLLPSPMISKINERIFCIVNERNVKIFFFNKNDKVRKTFQTIDFMADENVNIVSGNGTDHVFLIMKSKITVLILKRTSQSEGYNIIKTDNIKIAGILGFTYRQQMLYALTPTSLYQCKFLFYIVDSETYTLTQKKLSFETQQDLKLFDSLKPITMISESSESLYYFGAKADNQIYLAMKKNVNLDATVKKNCEILVLVKINLKNDKMSHSGVEDQQPVTSPTKTKATSQQEKLQLQFFSIDHVFETGIFEKAKVFVLGKDQFLMQIYEEVLLVKKHFKKFIIWDNIGILASKNQSKKGQLILADKRIMVYSEIGEIYAYDIFFNQEQSKLNTPKIDSFKGNDNDDQILFSAVLLQYKANTLMKVLFYFKSNQISLPTKGPQLLSADKTDNRFSINILCIMQSDPKQKLLDLLAKKKPPNQIDDFVKRFGISKLELDKSKWIVSQKTIKDIENSLLEIADDAFIEEQLNTILKKKAHDLRFLTVIEKKQTQRLAKQLAASLIRVNSLTQDNFEAESSYTETQQQRTYIIQVIKWLMQSIMFQKKLNYSTTFLSFKEYDFIQIGKLKAASLKEEIKLLSCKKFEKRLKFFLNSFKFLAIASYDETFEFLLDNKTEEELQQFIQSFSFILPPPVETSKVFMNKQRAFDLMVEGSLIQVEKKVQEQEQCILWDDFLENQDPSISMSPTKRKNQLEDNFSNLENFQVKVINAIKNYNLHPEINEFIVKDRAIKRFKNILNDFVQQSWYINSAFKQHSTLPISTQELKDKFYELKDDGVFNHLINLLYRRINDPPQKAYHPDKVYQLLNNLVSSKLMAESFRKNIEARVIVYKVLQDDMVNAEQHINNARKLAKLEDFLILKEDKYFEYLFHGFKPLILRDIKDAYDKMALDFFRQRFQCYLNSPLVNLKVLINFMDEFNESKADEIRLDAFKTIKKLLKLSDYSNTKRFNDKTLDKSIFQENKQSSINFNDLKEEAKIPYGFYFYHFFTAFELNNQTYEDLVNASQVPHLEKNDFVQVILYRYCTRKYKIDDGSCFISFQQGNILQKIETVNIHENPLGFFSILLLFLDTLDFKLDFIEVFNKMIQNSLDHNSFDELKTFIEDLNYFTIEDQQYPTKNWQLIYDLKQQNHLLRIFAATTISWIQNKYSQIQSLDAIIPVFTSIEKTFQLLNYFVAEGVLEREKAYFETLRAINKFDKSILLNTDYLREQLNQTGFFFMIHMMKNSKDLKAFKTDDLDLLEDATFNLISMYSHFKQAANGEIVDTLQSTELIRFFIQLCMQLIHMKRYVATQHVLLKIVGSSIMYFKDIVYIFLSVMRYTALTTEQMEEFMREFINIETPSFLKKRIQAIIQTGQKFEEDIEYTKSGIIRIFKILLECHKPIQAFYFLHRLDIVGVTEVISVVNSMKVYDQISLAPHFLMTIYIKNLQKYLGDQFYPTYEFFQSKLEFLNSEIDRNDVIKDVNIGLNRLQYQISEQTDEQKKKKIISSFEDLQKFYNQFMRSINQDPYIKLTQEDFLDAAQKIDRYSRHIPPDLLNAKTDEAITRSDLKKNQQQLVKLNQHNQANVIEKQIHYAISDAKKTAKKYEAMILQRKSKSPNNLASQKLKTLSSIQAQKKDQIDTITMSYKSSTSARVQNIIEQLRNKRKKAITESRVKVESEPYSPPHSLLRAKKQQIETTKSRVKQQESWETRRKQLERQQLQKQMALRKQRELAPSIFSMNTPKKPQIFQAQRKQESSKGDTSKVSNASRYQIKVNSEAVFKKKERQEKIGQNFPNSASKLDNFDLKKKLQESRVSVSASRVVHTQKVSYEELEILFTNSEPEAVKYLPKLQLIKQNMRVGAQLIKRIHSIIVNFNSFIKFLQYMLSLDEKFKQIIQQKAVGIYNQMIKMDVKIDMKELLPIELFTVVNNTTLKEYHIAAFEMIRPHLVKILEQTNINIHGIAILFRYGFGSQNTYFYKVYQEFIRVNLKNYQFNAFDERALFLLTEKMKNLYSNLNPDNRALRFLQLVDEMPIGDKKKKLINSLESCAKKCEGSNQQQFVRTVTQITRKSRF